MRGMNFTADSRRKGIRQSFSLEGTRVLCVLLSLKKLKHRVLWMGLNLEFLWLHLKHRTKAAEIDGWGVGGGCVQGNKHNPHYLPLSALCFLCLEQRP